MLLWKENITNKALGGINELSDGRWWTSGAQRKQKGRPEGRPFQFSSFERAD
jgi:hypothetical protein